MTSSTSFLDASCLFSIMLDADLCLGDYSNPVCPLSECLKGEQKQTWAKRHRAPCTLDSLTRIVLSLCASTTASLNIVGFFFNIIGFCSCCHVPSSGVSVVFGWSSWRVCLCLSLFARGCGCVVLRRKDAGRKKSAERKETPRGCLWSDETNDIVTTRNAYIWVSSDWIPILGVTIRIPKSTLHSNNSQLK